MRSREEHRTTNDKESQTGHNCSLVRVLPDNVGRGQGNQEVPTVKGRLHKGRRRVTQGKDGLELGDQDVV